MTLQPEPDWLKKRIEQRLEWMVRGGAIETAKEAGAPFIFTFLDEGDPNMTAKEQERWERTCDNCGRYIAPDAPDGPDGFYTGHISRNIDGFQILMAFGSCGTCKEVTTMKGTEDD